MHSLCVYIVLCFTFSLHTHQLHNVLCKALARLIHQDFDSFSSSQKSSLFDLLGRTFFERHMDTCKIEFDTQVIITGTIPS